MAAYDPATWSDLFVAVAGAAAALAGLLFVAVSINLDAIVAERSLAERAGETVTFLVVTLVIAVVCLLPDQRREVLGLEVLVVALVGWAVPVRLQLVNARRPNPGVEHRVYRAVSGQLATLPYVVGGITILIGSGGGLYWVGAGTALSFIAATLAAWVLMIEIKR